MRWIEGEDEGKAWFQRIRFQSTVAPRASYAHACETTAFVQKAAPCSHAKARVMTGFCRSMKDDSVPAVAWHFRDGQVA